MIVNFVPFCIIGINLYTSDVHNYAHIIINIYIVCVLFEIIIRLSRVILVIVNTHVEDKMLKLIS